MHRAPTSHEMAAAHVPLPAPPKIPGLRFRPLQGSRDYAGLVAVHRACSEVDGLDDVVTEAELANFVENADGFDPSLDFTLAEVEGGAVAYSWISHRLQTTGDEIHVHRGYVHPAWRRRGLGAALLHQVTRRSEMRRLTPAGQRFLQSYVADGEVSAAALLRSRGYSPVRYSFKMVRGLSRSIPHLPLPDGLEIRPAEPVHFRAIWEAEREAFQDHWGYAPWPEENYLRFLAFPHYDPSLWRVAWDGDQVAGSVLSYIHPDENAHHGRLRGYTEDISVRRPWRRRGLASALIAASMRALKDRGMTEAALEVDSENPTGALRVYERLGYTTTFRRTLYRKPLAASAQG